MSDMYLFCNSKEISQAIAQELYRYEESRFDDCWTNGAIGYWYNQREIDDWFKKNTEEYKYGCGLYRVDGIALYKLYGDVCRTLEKRDLELFPHEWSSFRLRKRKSIWDALEDTKILLETIFDKTHINGLGLCREQADLSWRVRFTYAAF